MENIADTSSNAGPAPKRKRVVTACLECYRRKQKCDRNKPCQNCVGRNVAAKCIYEQPPPPTTAPESKSHSPVSAEDLDEDGVSLTEAKLDESAFSSFYDVHAFTDLKKLLEDEEVFQTSSLAGDKSENTKIHPRFWILAVQLPDPRVLVKAFNYYFNEVHWRYNVGQRCYMDKQLERWTSVVSIPASQRTGLDKDLPYFVVFSFQLLAVLLQFMRPNCELARLLHANNEKACSHMSRRYHDVASELMLVIGRNGGTITVVDYDLLRASWLKNIGRGIESWYAISDGVRQAQQLNLHREPQSTATTNDMSQTLEQFWLQEYRRRVWVNLFCWDSGVAMNLGRPRIINAKDCDVNLPLDCPFPENPSQAVPILKDEHTPSPLSLLLVRYAIAGKVHEIRECGLDKQDANYTSVWAFHNELNNLLSNLPSYLNPNNTATHLDSKFQYLPLHRREVLSQLDLILMELHRPFVASQPNSRIAAMNAAIRSIDSQRALLDFSGKHHYIYFGFGFYPSNAAILLAAIALIYPDRHNIRIIEQKVQQALLILNTVRDINIVARAALPVVQRLCDKIEDSSRQIQSGSSNVESPESIPSQDSGYIPMTIPFMDSALVAPGSNQFVIDNADLPPLQDLPDMSAWSDMPQVNDFDASFWLDQLNKLPEQTPINAVVNPQALWSQTFSTD